MTFTGIHIERVEKRFDISLSRKRISPIERVTKTGEQVIWKQICQTEDMFTLLITLFG